MTKPPTVHKYSGDDPTATRTACGLWLRDRYVQGWPTPLAVDADARKATCGNCNRPHRTNDDTHVSLTTSATALSIKSIVPRLRLQRGLR